MCVHFARVPPLYRHIIFVVMRIIMCISLIEIETFEIRGASPCDYVQMCSITVEQKENSQTNKIIHGMKW